jgi:hypothetical protein
VNVVTKGTASGVLYPFLRVSSTGVTPRGLFPAT